MRTLLLLLGLTAVLAARPGVAHAGESPSDLAARFRQAQALAATDATSAVAAYTGLLVPAFPAPDAVHLALARLLPPAAARPHWRAIVDADPPSPYLPEALGGLAASLAAEGRVDEAVALLRRRAAVDPEEEGRCRALLAAARLLLADGHEAEARAAAEAVWVDYAYLPEADAAEPILEAPEGDPLRSVGAERVLARGERLLARGRRERAVETLRALRQRLEPESPILPELDLALGKALYFLRRYPEALAALERARGRAKTDEQARFYRARCLFGLDRGDEGAADLVALARERPESPGTPTYLYQAVRVFEGRRMWERAAGARKLLLERHGDADEAREIRWGEGWRAYGEGRPLVAADAFARSAAGAAPGWIRARGLYWEARARLEAGQAAEGRAGLERVRREFPLGYYAHLAGECLTGDGPRLAVADPRTAAGRALPAWEPDATAPREPELDRAAVYLTLGLPEGARRVLAAGGGTGPRWARFFYWAGDYRRAIRAAERGWLDWPGDGSPGPTPLSAEGLAFPFAYPELAARAAAEAGIHPHLLLAVARTESHFDPKAYSAWEARGLMQFIPATGEATARTAGLEAFEAEDLFDPATALRLGALHLRELLDRFGGDWVAAVAAYNAGAAAVERWRDGWAGRPPDAVVESIPYRETRRYVKKVATALDAYDRLDPPGLWREEAP